MLRRLFFLSLVACGGPPPGLGDASVELPRPACEAAGGTREVASPELVATLADRWHEAWLGSPAVADLDGDGEREILAPRGGLLLGWHLDGSVVVRHDVGGRIWAPPVVADLVPERAGLEVAVAARGAIHAWGADAAALPGFPVTWQDELRSIGAGDVDGDGRFELVAVTTTPLASGGGRDIVIAVNDDGTFVPGFPPHASGASGCDDRCYVTGGYDQNVALGDVNGDGVADVLATQDNAYLSLHDGTGRAFDAAPIFEGRTKILGVRFLHDYALAQMGWAPDEEAANQAHFTNSAPAIADVDGDGRRELVVLGSVQNAAQTDRLRGVALWVFRGDGTRPPGWEQPFHAPGYLAGLWDFEGVNVVGATNQVAVADLDPDRPGPEMVFAGFDGRIHAVDARANELWSTVYTESDRVLTGGVAVADLSGDGSPEIVFATYSPDEGAGALFVLDAAGTVLHRVPLPGRGAMPVPTIDDADGDGTLDIVVSLKDGEDRARQLLVYRVPGSSPSCLPWPTGRGSYRRDGFVPCEDVEHRRVRRIAMGFFEDMFDPEFLFDSERKQRADIRNLRKKVEVLAGHSDPRIEVLARQVGQLSLLCNALVEILERKKLATREELTVLVQQIDLLDGREDGFQSASEWRGAPRCRGCNYYVNPAREACIYCGEPLPRARRGGGTGGPYRGGPDPGEPEAAPRLATCARCGERVPQCDTLFTEDGELRCTRCHA